MEKVHVAKRSLPPSLDPVQAAVMPGHPIWRHRAPTPGNAAAQHLQRYAKFLISDGSLGEDARLMHRLETTLFDLILLALEGNGDAADLARQRGLRAARLNAIKAMSGRILVSETSRSPTSPLATALRRATYICCSRRKRRRSPNMSMIRGSGKPIAS